MNKLSLDTLIGLIIIFVIIAVLVLYVMNDKVNVWHPMNVYPNCEDQRNIINVRIKSIEDENCKEVHGYFDVSKQCYYSYTNDLIIYKFKWCYE